MSSVHEYFMMEEHRRRSQDHCPNHPDSQLVEDYKAGDLICPKCGLVVGNRVIDIGSEWRAFNTERGIADPSRVGGAENPLLEGGDLTTLISGGHGDAAFDENGVAKYQNRRSTTSSADRTVQNACNGISEMAARLEIPKVIADRAKSFFKIVHDKRNVKGKSNDAVAAAVLYIACRKESSARTFKEICKVAKSSKKEISRCFKQAAEIIKSEGEGDSLKSVSTDDFMDRFCHFLGLPAHIKKAATFIARNTIDNHLAAGRSPISVAAAAIYMASQASKDKRTQKQVAEVAGVADVTIRQSYKLMYPKAKSLFPKDFVFETPLDQLPLA